MKIVLDTNILFSFFWRESVTRRLLITSNFELITPLFTLKELKKYSRDIINKTKISEKDFNLEIKKLQKIVSFVKEQDYSEFLKEAEEISPDKGDVDFLALCLKNPCFLWSNDSLLKKQSKIRVLSAEGIINVLF